MIAGEITREWNAPLKDAYARAPQIFELTRLDEVISIFDTAAEALAVAG